MRRVKAHHRMTIEPRGYEGYKEPDELRRILTGAMQGRRYRLDCGHYVKLGENTNLVLLNNGEEPLLVCTSCC